jgi:hypothetical protein
MNTDDKVLAMKVRHSFTKSLLDISELNVSCHSGCIELTGKVKRPRNHPGGANLNVRKELENLKQMARNTAGVKSLYADKINIID